MHMLKVLADQLNRADHFLGMSDANFNTQCVIKEPETTSAGNGAGDTEATPSIAKTERAKIQRATKPKSEILMRPESEDMVLLR